MQVSFGDTNSVVGTKFDERDRPTSTCASNIRLLACNIPWEEETLIDQFFQGLCNDMKDLLFTFHEDPHLFERYTDYQQMLCFKLEQIYALVVETPQEVPRSSSIDAPTLMEIETTRHRGPLSDVEKQ